MRSKRLRKLLKITEQHVPESGLKTKTVLKRMHISCCHTNKIYIYNLLWFWLGLSQPCLCWTLQTPSNSPERLHHKANSRQFSIQYSTQSHASLFWGMIFPFSVMPSPFSIAFISQCSSTKVLTMPQNPGQSLTSSEVLPYYPTPSRRINLPFLCYFWTFKPYIQLLNVMISLHAISRKESSLGTGLIHLNIHSTYQQYTQNGGVVL